MISIILSTASENITQSDHEEESNKGEEEKDEKEYEDSEEKEEQNQENLGDGESDSGGGPEEKEEKEEKEMKEQEENEQNEEETVVWPLNGWFGTCISFGGWERELRRLGLIAHSYSCLQADWYDIKEWDWFKSLLCVTP